VGRVIKRAVRLAVPPDKSLSREAEIKRENTLIRIFTGALTVVVVTITVLMILEEAGVKIGPILAGAGIVGVAVGFGSQYLVRDLITGLFLILENQYRIGDVVNLNGTSGAVEDISLRKTTLRDLDGTVHHIPNGEITRVSNLSKVFSRVNLNMGVSYSTNLEHVISVINRTGKELAEDPYFKDLIITPPQFLRVDDFADSSVVVKILGDTQPLKQWEVTGELRKRLKIAFDSEGLKYHFHKLSSIKPKNNQMTNLNYGVIGNCRGAALVSERGSIDWCCMPDFDSPSVFAKLLDSDKGGSCEICTDGSYSVTQEYMRNTNILRTIYKSGGDAFEVVDFMPRYKISDYDYFTPSEIHRYIRLLSGKPSFRIIYDPKLNYAREDVRHIDEEDYLISYSVEHPTDCIYLYSSLNLKDITSQNDIELTGDEFMLISYNQKLITIDIDRVYLEYVRTKVYWLNWTNRSKRYNLYNNLIVRSLLVLKIMTYDPTGAVLAALTTSIPETIGEVRNWDYRFCWLRDASMSIDTLLKMGHYNAAQRYLTFIKNILKTKHDTFQIMYGIRGERDLSETGLPHLDGYENSKPVRIGNAAYTQRQNDVFGYMLNVIYQYYKYFPRSLDEIEDMWEIVRNIARTVSTHWEKPDQGIWEIRNEEKHFVSSKIMSWVAMDRAANIALLLNKKAYAASWTDIANDIKDDVMKSG
jgi:GH15 family glucan-1,4-alpha-glucosidase/small-conductance mechanosensitive channel